MSWCAIPAHRHQKNTPARDGDCVLHAVRHTGVRVVQMHRCANRGPNIPVELTSGIGAILLTGMREKAFPIASCGLHAGSSREPLDGNVGYPCYR